MNRAEMKRKVREQEKCRLPLNFKMQLGQVAGLTGQQSMILQNYLKARENEIWVGTFREVVSYIKEREETKLEVVNKKNTLLIAPELKLDQELFVEPLTMVITGKEIKKVTVKQGKRKLPVQITDDKVLFDFDPYGGMIKVTLKIQK